MKSNINIFDQKAHVTDFRIPKKARFPDLFYYDIRHSDTDMFEPSTIEGRVVVNYYGTLTTEQKLDCLGLNFISLTDQQKQLIMRAIDGIEGVDPDEQTEEYLTSLQEDRALNALERSIHIGEHGGELNE